MKRNILVYFIKIDLEPSETQDIIEVLILHAIDSTFVLGENCLAKKSKTFIITKVENFDNIYEFLPNNNKIRIINKKTGCTDDVENNLKFDSYSKPKVVFSKSVKKNILFGLDETAKAMYPFLNFSSHNSLLCLHGPSGSGKRLLLENFEIEFENRHFFWLNDLDAKTDVNYLMKLYDDIRSCSAEVVLCYVVTPEILADKSYNQRILYFIFDKLLKKSKFLRIKIVISCENIDLLSEKILRLSLMIFSVRNLNIQEKSEFIKFLIGTRTGRDQFEEEFEMVARALHGFTAGDIARFINEVEKVDRNLSLTEMVKCSRNKEFIPKHLLKFKIDFQPIHWEDICGYEAVKQLLREEIEIPLKAGRTPVKGVLLHGPPGCSKTMFARVLATECQIGLFSITPASVMSRIVGQSEQILSEIIQQAVVSAPSIIFIDEIDMLLPKRTDSEISVPDRLLNQLMTFIDGIHSRQDDQVILMAATNQLDSLDKALIRPGRMDLVIKINLPDQTARESILQTIFSDNKFKVDPEVMKNIPSIAGLIENNSGGAIVDFGNSVKNLSEFPTDMKSSEFISDPIITMDHICKILSAKFKIDSIL